MSISDSVELHLKPQTRSRLRALLEHRSFWALGDQGVVSLGNFITNILLARTLPLKEYGIYGVLLLLIFLLNSLQTSLVIYPLGVKGAKVDDASLRRLATVCLLLTLALAIPLGAAIFIGGAVTGALSVAPIAAGAMVVWQMQETVRRALMAHLRYRAAVWGDALAYLGQAMMVWLLVRSGHLTLSWAFGTLALTCSIALLVQTIQIGIAPLSWQLVRGTTLAFVHLGRWMLLANLVNVLTGASWTWALALFHGVEVVGVSQALNNILKFANPVMLGITSLIVPAAARAHHETGIQGAWRAALRPATHGAVLLFPAFAAILIWPDLTVRLFYGSDSNYAGYQTIFRVIVAGYPLLYVNMVLTAFLNALERSRATFFTQVGCTLTIMLVGLPLVIWGGLLGAAWGGLIATGVMAAISCFWLRHARREETRAAQAAESEELPPLSEQGVLP